MSECENISIRIFGVPERMDMIRTNQERLNLPDDHIFIDEKHNGCVWNAKRAWLHPTDKEFTLVLSDDVELCKDFLKYLHLIAKTQPNFIISLYSNRFNKRNNLKHFPEVSPYVLTHLSTGPGIMMRTEWVTPCLNSWKDSNPCDDGNINDWARDTGVQILTTIPQIIQHIGRHSIVDPTRDLGSSELYDENPVNVNWENNFINTTSNISRK